MHKYLLVTLLFFVSITCSGSVDTIRHEYKIRNAVWFTPVFKNTKINGLALGLYAAPWKETDHLIINGISIEANPLGLLFGFVYPFFGTIVSAFINQSDTTIPQQDIIRFRNIYPESSNHITEMTGLSISAGTIPATGIKGFALTVTTTYADFSGISICGIMNCQYSFKGISIAGLRNKAANAKGLQIGLINAAKDGQVVQIGLINRIGRRTLPFINLKLGKHRNN